MIKHGFRHTKTYLAWANMKTRCNNPNYNGRKNYYDRGIKYDPAWNVFDNFLADMGVCPKDFQLDRINNDGDYTKKNCRWTTKKINMQIAGLQSLLTDKSC